MGAIAHCSQEIELSSLNDEDRVHLGLAMGLTVVMGGITTMGAGLFMWFCVVTFFTKFCILIVSTISFSLNAALFFFKSTIGC